MRISDWSSDVCSSDLVRGPVAGIGCSLALAADFCVASETAYFLQAFVNIGLVPDGGASWMLPRLVGRARAAEMMMHGERIPAAKALDWGLIPKYVADDVPDAEALALAERLEIGGESCGRHVCQCVVIAGGTCPLQTKHHTKQTSNIS